jgi:hypothetical protein
MGTMDSSIRRAILCVASMAKTGRDDTMRFDEGDLAVAFGVVG